MPLFRPFSRQNAGQTEALASLARITLGAHVRSVGFELEGGINAVDRERLERYVSERGLDPYYIFGRETDLNVATKDFSNCEIKFWNTDLKIAVKFLHFAYMECGFETNRNCGFHVHMTFDDMPGAVSFFSSPTIQDEFRGLYRAGFREEKYLSRLENSWCMDNGVHSIVAKINEDNSFGLIPYVRKASIAVDAYRARGTIEFRLLPNQENGKEAERSLKWILRTVDDLYGRHNGLASDSAVTTAMVEEDKAYYLKTRGDYKPR